MSVELTFTGQPAGSERVADEWETIEVAFDPASAGARRPRP